MSTATGFVTSTGATILVNDGDLPPWPASIGAVSPDTTAMLARANLLRADAGLPPLIGDALLAKAARNHANYDKQWDEGHYESGRNAGYTGMTPGLRCQFVGTTCNEEVMYRGPSGSSAVDDWIATPFHRPPLLDPRAGIVGPAQSDGAGQTTSVMDSGEDDLQELVAEVGYPQGTYRGPLAFHGESPDPADACARNGQPVTYPLGAAVTLFAPGAALMTGVREVGGAALAGCVLRDGRSRLPYDRHRRGWERVRPPRRQAGGIWGGQGGVMVGSLVSGSCWWSQDRLALTAAHEGRSLIRGGAPPPAPTAPAPDGAPLTAGFRANVPRGPSRRSPISIRRTQLS